MGLKLFGHASVYIILTPFCPAPMTRRVRGKKTHCSPRLVCFVSACSLSATCSCVGVEVLLTKKKKDGKTKYSDTRKEIKFLVRKTSRVSLWMPSIVQKTVHVVESQKWVRRWIMLQCDVLTLTRCFQGVNSVSSFKNKPHLFNLELCNNNDPPVPALVFLAYCDVIFLEYLQKLNIPEICTA